VTADAAVPILPARDLLETRAFYERFHFEAKGWWPDAFGGYAIMVRDGLELHFFAFPDLQPGDNYAGCYWRVGDVDALYDACRAELPGSGIPRVTPAENKPWGMREFAMVDPNGNLIRVGQPIA
jgi:catechol 2,3-dioxygenase-like lactoylglutathione lyase family enzyme